MGSRTPQQISAWPSLNPSQLRHRVQIVAPCDKPDAFGQPDVKWNPVTERWARIRTLSERELAQSDDLASQVTHEITMRFPRGEGISIDETMRVLYRSRTYKIQALNNIEERDVVLKILALEIDGSE